MQVKNRYFKALDQERSPLRFLLFSPPLTLDGLHASARLSLTAVLGAILVLRSRIQNSHRFTATRSGTGQAARKTAFLVRKGN